MAAPDLRGKRVLVVGLAQTGIALARFAARRGARVVVNDGKPAEALGERLSSLRAALAEVGPLEHEVELALGGHPEAVFTGADLVVMSPGVPEMPAMGAARAAGIEVVAEIELAYRFLHPDALLVAITGTNGKSTTTALTGSLCEASGRPTFCGGNLGNHPLIDAVDHPANVAGGYVVAEVAGFMLETCSSFRPRAAACLNITEDHLDRYGTMEVYASMKTRVYRWQTEKDAAIANAHCERAVAGARASRARLFLFDSTGEVERGAFLSPDRKEILLRLGEGGSSGAGSGPEERYPVADLPIVGMHNMENAMAAYLCARMVGVEPEAIRRGAAAFRPQKHRMELVGRRGEVVFYDDSKGTNVAAVAASVRGFPRPVVLIAGGLDKGGSYEPMFQALDGVARGMVLIGQAAPLIRAAAAEHRAGYPVLDAGDMHEAVRLAADLARPGDAVVLSPACASYDMFDNFGHRGRVFRDAVGAIGAERLDL